MIQELTRMASASRVLDHMMELEHLLEKRGLSKARLKTIGTSLFLECRPTGALRHCPALFPYHWNELCDQYEESQLISRFGTKAEVLAMMLETATTSRLNREGLALLAFASTDTFLESQIPVSWYGEYEKDKLKSLLVGASSKVRKSYPSKL